MKKVLLTVLAGVVIGAAFVPVLAADDAEKKVTFDGEVRARFEYLNNYLDLTSGTTSGDQYDDAYSMAPYRVMVGITGNFTRNVVGHVDLQYVGVLGDEEPQKDFGGPTGQGETPYQFVTQGVQLYTGWIEMNKIGGTDLAARLGRQEDTYGTELFKGDNDYYAGLSFDGLRGMWKHGHNDLSVFYYKVFEANTAINGPGPDLGSVDSNFWGANYDWAFTNWGTVGGYIYVNQNLDGNGPTIGNPDTSITTCGARWNRGMMTGDKLNMFDWNIELAGQSGDANGPGGGPKIDIGSWIGEGWFAFNFKAGNSHGRVHIGTLMTSGDDFNTTKYEGFINLYGDFHAYNRFGDLDWVDGGGPAGAFAEANITDFNIGYEHWFGDVHYLMFAYHNFTETQSNGAPSDKLGDEFDLTYGYKYSKNLSFQTTVGQANPGAAAQANLETPAKDPVQRVTAQAKLTW